jgi:hypothetical protein
MKYDPTDAAQRHEAVRQHYLSLPGKTEAGWAEVMVSPAKYNRVWNHMLRLPPSDKPPRSVRENPYTHHGKPVEGAGL